MQRVSAPSTPTHLPWAGEASPGTLAVGPLQRLSRTAPSPSHTQQPSCLSSLGGERDGEQGSRPAEWILLPSLGRKRGCQTTPALLAFGFGAPGICPGVVEKKGPRAV